jgi:hypothetical protein
MIWQAKIRLIERPAVTIHLSDAFVRE